MKLAGFLLFAAVLLGFIAWHRAPEYDEAYSIFLTAGHARPAWPSGIFTAGSVRGFFSGHASLGQISHDLKTGDVHPPLYFWMLEFWRHLFGPSWFTARLLSIIFSLGSLAVIAWFALAAEIPVIPALSIALLSYGFAYTGIAARGFALAQFLNLLGFALVFQAARWDRRRLALAGGLALGAASFTNYLAVFIGCALFFWLCISPRRWRLLLPATAGLLPFLALDATYFAAQRSSRTVQFVPFSPLHALALLVKDSGAALFGGLPLYAGRAGPAIAMALLLLFIACLAYVIMRNHKPAVLLALASIAPPCGLLALGVIFHNTPIEIRYLCFSMPFLALLFAAALPRWLLMLLLGAEFCAITGLAFAPATMQPQGLSAQQAATMPGALILLPFGNDGVGVPGPFIAALPNTARLELLRPGKIPDLIHERKIILATISADISSTTTTAQALAYFRAQQCFTVVNATNLTAEILNRCADQQP